MYHHKLALSRRDRQRLLYLKDLLFYVEQYNRKHPWYFQTGASYYIMNYLERADLTTYLPKATVAAFKELAYQGELDYNTVIHTFIELGLI